MLDCWDYIPHKSNFLTPAMPPATAVKAHRYLVARTEPCCKNPLSENHWNPAGFQAPSFRWGLLTTYVDFIVKAYEEQENDRAARIIRSSYTGDYGEQGKVVLDEAVKQTVHYETGWYEPDILGSGGSYRGVTKVDSEEEALQQLQKHAANYAQRITIYKKDGRTVKREVAEYDQWEKKWMS